MNRPRAKSVRVTIVIPSDLLTKLDAWAEKEQRSRSQADHEGPCPKPVPRESERCGWGVRCGAYDTVDGKCANCGGPHAPSSDRPPEPGKGEPKPCCVRGIADGHTEACRERTGKEEPCGECGGSGYINALGHSAYCPKCKPAEPKEPCYPQDCDPDCPRSAARSAEPPINNLNACCQARRDSSTGEHSPACQYKQQEKP